VLIFVTICVWLYSWLKVKPKTRQVKISPELVASIKYRPARPSSPQHLNRVIQLSGPTMDCWTLAVILKERLESAEPQKMILYHGGGLTLATKRQLLEVKSGDEQIAARNASTVSRSG
jgi:hypothetical protein